MNPREKVKKYYRKIDACDVDWVINLFADDGKYQRADVLYSGKQAITDFYRGERKIRGNHFIEKIFAEADSVVSHGIFEGIGADGSLKKIGFADIWEFNNSGLVVIRKTYLATGSAYVKD